jgi:eukaryotic-like serine/threonine-protein kinase
MKFLSDTALDHLREVADQPDLAGTPYEITGTIGRGGMATVYLARDRDLDREVALKVVDVPEGPGEAAARTLREARILARLEHPGIVPVHDVGILPDGRVWYVMKRVRGRRLDDYARAASLAERLRAFLRICEAVAFAHAHGVIHRDLKPENVMVGPFGEVLVMDWGVAKEGEGQDAHGTILGTPGYMAPEQERGDIERIDERTDVFGLGAILGFLLAGEEEDIPRPLDAIRRRAMATAPEDRYPAVDALASDLALYLDGLPVTAYRESPLERVARFVRRYHTPILVILAYLLMRMVLLAVLGR